jgi:hypothetical protein
MRCDGWRARLRRAAHEALARAGSPALAALAAAVSAAELAYRRAGGYGHGRRKFEVRQTLVAPPSKQGEMAAPPGALQIMDPWTGVWRTLWNHPDQPLYNGTTRIPTKSHETLGVLAGLGRAASIRDQVSFGDPHDIEYWRAASGNPPDLRVVGHDFEVVVFKTDLQATGVVGLVDVQKAHAAAQKACDQAGVIIMDWVPLAFMVVDQDEVCVTLRFGALVLESSFVGSAMAWNGVTYSAGLEGYKHAVRVVADRWVDPWLSQGSRWQMPWPSTVRVEQKMKEQFDRYFQRAVTLDRPLWRMLHVHLRGIVVINGTATFNVTLPMPYGRMLPEDMEWVRSTLEAAVQATLGLSMTGQRLAVASYMEEVPVDEVHVLGAREVLVVA